MGAIAVGFTLWQWIGCAWVERGAGATQPSAIAGSFWSGVSGYTSFVAHAGGPPLSVYLPPLRMPMAQFVGTTVVYFTLVNYVKLLPYALLGQFDSVNLAMSLMLLPLAPVGVLLGVMQQRRMREGLLYGVVYPALLLTGLKLLWDGSALFR